MKGKKLRLKIAILALCSIVVINAFITVDDYLLKMFRIFLTICFIPFFMILMRNIKMSNGLFKFRFYWYYPVILLVTFILFGGVTILFKVDHLSNEKIIGGLMIFLGLGVFMGLVERLREHKYLSDNTLSETVDLVTEDLDTINRGVLIRNKNFNFAFKKKGETIFEFINTDVKTVNIKKEYKIFPIMLEVELNNGEKYDFESQFPFVWKKLLTAH